MPPCRPFASVRDCPLDTAGDRCLWHAGGTAGETTMLPPARRRLQLDRRVRPVLGEPLLVGKSPEGLAAAGWGIRILQRPPSPFEVRAPVGPATCGSAVQQRSADRPCPLLSAAHRPAADPARTSTLGVGGLSSSLVVDAPGVDPAQGAAGRDHRCRGGWLPAPLSTEADDQQVGPGLLDLVTDPVALIQLHPVPVQLLSPLRVQ
jgi:hypothetical protein